LSNKLEVCDNFKRLLAFNFMAGWIECMDGHIWIEYDDENLSDSSFHSILDQAGLCIHSKIYEGVACALDVVDDALKKAGHASLLDTYYEWSDVEDYIVPGETGVDISGYVERRK